MSFINSSRYLFSSLTRSFMALVSSLLIFWISSCRASIFNIRAQLIFEDFLILASMLTPRFFFLATSSSLSTPLEMIFDLISSLQASALSSIFLTSLSWSSLMTLRKSAMRSSINSLCLGFLQTTLRDPLSMSIRRLQQFPRRIPMKNEAFFLEGRLTRVETFLGLNEDNTTIPKVKLNEKVLELAQKWPKDTQVKYDKIKKLTNTYNRVLEGTITPDQMQTLEDEQEELNEIAGQLEQIEQLSVAMNFEPLLKIHQKSKDLHLLSTGSKLEFKDLNSPLTVVSYSEEELSQVNQTQRSQFEQVVTLYNQIIANLNGRLQALFNKLVRMETK